MTGYHCRACGSPIPEEPVYRCPSCAGVFSFADGIQYHPAMVEENLPGIWRYRHTFGLPDDAPIITLGEGNTPLVEGRLGKQDALFKLESLNPTGSFKDRLTAPLIAYVKTLGETTVVEDSSGNAGASFAAYAARAGIRGRVYVPEYASGPKRTQIQAYGAEVVAVAGPRSKAAEAVQQAVQGESLYYASHAYLPQGIAGLATISYELVAQIGKPPGTVVAPVGHGSLLLGIIHGFLALQRASVIDQPPNFIGVQAKRCAPLWEQFSGNPVGHPGTVEGKTIAEGIRVLNPVRGPELININEQVNLQILAVEEDQIKKGRDLLSVQGFYVEATSGVVAAALTHISPPIVEPLVFVLTGSGLKSD